VALNELKWVALHPIKSGQGANKVKRATKDVISALKNGYE
jgi:hypothetical protein